MQQQKLKVNIGKPKARWLPVTIVRPGFALEFAASAVPADSIADVVQALLLASQGADAAVLWSLEPLKDRFSFSAQPAGQVALVAEELSATAVTRIFDYQASCKSVVLPFWRALQQLDPADFAGNAWYSLPREKLQKLMQLLQAREPG